YPTAKETAMPLSLDDYLNPDKFPVTSREGLSAQQQFRIDAFNYDNLVRYKDEGNALDEEQVAILKELEVKVPAQKDLRDAVRNG
ncbi:MAG: hypothetical protein VKL42_22835, partial [Snowella sp.]|nr:hypothetical protein [Snowella sp.]